MHRRRSEGRRCGCLDRILFVATIIRWKFTFDPAKRAATLAERGLDFTDAAEVLQGDTLDFPDDRRDYGELRMLRVGHLRGRMVIIVWTPRGKAHHLDEEDKCPRKSALWEAI